MRVRLIGRAENGNPYAMARKLPKSSRRAMSAPRPQLSIPELDDARLKAESHFAPYIPEPPSITASKIGRPSSYDPRFCEIVRHQAALGHTIGATAALIGVSRSTILDWASVHPEFAQAIALAKAARQLFYEGHLLDLIRRGGDSTRLSAVKLGLINCGGDDWKERVTTDHSVTLSWASLLAESLRPIDEAGKTVTLEQEPINMPTDGQD